MSAAAPAWAAHLPSGVDPEDVDLLARQTLPRAWVALWRADPDRRTLRDVDGTWLTRGDLSERTERVASRLAAAGLRPGDRVLLSGSPSAALVVAHVAALRLGLVVVPVNDAYTDRELGVLLEDSRAVGALLEPAAMRRQAAEAGLAVVTGIDVDLPDGDRPPGSVPLDQAGPDDPALLPYTSGTTGRPKGALLSHGNLLASVEALLLAWRWTAEDRLVLALPLFHMHGLGVGVHGSLAAGASAVILPRFDAEAVLAEAADATMFFGVPTMHSRLADAPGAERLAGLRLCVSGSAPLSATLHGRIEDLSGQRILERYGMTETVMLVSNPYDGERRPGTVGFPLPGVDLRLDPDSAEIQVRGPNVFGGYDARPEATATAFTDDGWFRTGDIGTIDPDGYVSIVGRAKELIISGGFNVYPREIEDLIRARPGVRDVAVVGTPSEEWGEIVTAVVEAPEDVDVDDVVAAVAADLVPYKRPRLVRRVDALPRNAMGKVVRDALVDPQV